MLWCERSRKAVNSCRPTFSRAALETNCSVIFTLFMQMVSVKSSVTCSACALVSPTFSNRLICMKLQHVIRKPVSWFTGPSML